MSNLISDIYTKEKIISSDMLSKLETYEKELRENLKKIKEIPGKKLILLIGAGVSKDYGGKLWEELANEMLNYAFSKVDEGKKSLIPYIKEIDDPKEKITMAHGLLDDPSSSNLLYLDFLKQITQEDKIKNNIDNVKKDTVLKKLSSFMKGKSNNVVILSTNIDRFTEEVCSFSSYEVKTKKFKLDNSTKLVKMHGCISNTDDIVFLPNEYFSFYSAENEHLKDLSHLLKNSTIIFIGKEFESEIGQLIYTIKQRKKSKEDNIDVFLLKNYSCQDFELDKKLQVMDLYYTHLNIKQIPFLDYSKLPNFLDDILSSFHLISSDLLKSLENDTLSPSVCNVPSVLNNIIHNIYVNKFITLNKESKLTITNHYKEIYDKTNEYGKRKFFRILQYLSLNEIINEIWDYNMNDLDLFSIFELLESTQIIDGKKYEKIINYIEGSNDNKTSVNVLFSNLLNRPEIQNLEIDKLYKLIVKLEEEKNITYTDISFSYFYDYSEFYEFSINKFVDKNHLWNSFLSEIEMIPISLLYSASTNGNYWKPVIHPQIFEKYLKFSMDFIKNTNAFVEFRSILKLRFNKKTNEGKNYSTALLGYFSFYNFQYFDCLENADKIGIIDIFNGSFPSLLSRQGYKNFDLSNIEDMDINPYIKYVLCILVGNEELAKKFNDQILNETGKMIDEIPTVSPRERDKEIANKYKDELYNNKLDYEEFKKKLDEFYHWYHGTELDVVKVWENNRDFIMKLVAEESRSLLNDFLYYLCTYLSFDEVKDLLKKSNIKNVPNFISIINNVEEKINKDFKDGNLTIQILSSILDILDTFNLASKDTYFYKEYPSEPIDKYMTFLFLSPLIPNGEDYFIEKIKKIDYKYKNSISYNLGRYIPHIFSSSFSQKNRVGLIKKCHNINFYAGLHIGDRYNQEFVKIMCNENLYKTALNDFDLEETLVIEVLSSISLSDSFELLKDVKISKIFIDSLFYTLKWSENSKFSTFIIEELIIKRNLYKIEDYSSLNLSNVKLRNIHLSSVLSISKIMDESQNIDFFDFLCINTSIFEGHIKKEFDEYIMYIISNLTSIIPKLLELYKKREYTSFNNNLRVIFIKNKDDIKKIIFTDEQIRNVRSFFKKNKIDFTEFEGY